MPTHHKDYKKSGKSLTKRKSNMTKKTKKSKKLNNRSLRKKVYRKKNQKGKGLGNNVGNAHPAKRVGEDFITAVKELGTKNLTEVGSKDVAPTEINIITKTDTTDKEIKYFVLTFDKKIDAEMYYRNSNNKDRYYNPEMVKVIDKTFQVQFDEFLNQLGDLTDYKTSNFSESKVPTQIQLDHNQLMENIRNQGITL